MWTPTTRDQYSRTALRYETDLTDAEWAVIKPHMPPPAKLGRPPDWTFREIIDGIFYILRGGIPWRLMPTDLPPWPTASQSASLVRAAVFLRSAFSFAKNCSMGFRSGE